MLRFRGGSPPPPGSTAFRAFGLHLDGCPIARFDSRGAVNHMLDAQLEGAVRANGYFFETGAGPAEHDPVRWVVKAGRGGEGEAWETIGASLMLWNLTAVPVWALFWQSVLSIGGWLLVPDDIQTSHSAICADSRLVNDVVCMSSKL